MKTNFPGENAKIIVIACLMGVMLLGSQILFAQVKIGTNPATIEASSNLEIEASGPGIHKVKVDKGTGQVTIADGTEGAGKVFTSDVNGGGSWQNPLAGTMINGTSGGIASIPLNGDIYSGATITFPKAGTYMVYAKWLMSTSAAQSHAYINTTLSTSNSIDTQTAIAAEWVFVINGQQHTTPGFKVTATAGQTYHFFYYTGFYVGSLTMMETYAIGPF